MAHANPAYADLARRLRAHDADQRDAIAYPGYLDARLNTPLGMPFRPAPAWLVPPGATEGEKR